MNFLVTGGPTREHIDDVRFLSNPASGRLGIEISEAAADRGHSTKLILGPTHRSPDPDVSVKRVVSAADMKQAVMSEYPDHDVLVMAAAVADVRPAEQQSGKYRKEDIPKQLRLERTDDILQTVGEQDDRPFLVGFAVETDEDYARARGKLNRKNLDLICVNPPEAMGADRQSLTLIRRTEAEEPEEWTVDSKEQIARRLVARIERLTSSS